MATASAPGVAAIAFGDVVPILRVGNTPASVQYYVQKLGFRIGFLYPNEERPFFACVKRGACRIFLCEGDQGHVESWLWIDGEDVEALHEEFKASGAKIRNPPTNYEWALEMQVEDLDGNVLRIGCDSKKGEPFGPWLDMNGDRWVRSAEGAVQKLEP
jgi:uncharacterized glyoxalase superfamily protein PhnB